MSYAVLRVSPVSRADLAGMQAHVAREYLPPNARRDATHRVINLIGTGKPYEDFVASRFSTLRTFRKSANAPVGAEVILTAAASWFDTNYKGWRKNPALLNDWIVAQSDFLKKTFGDACVSAVVHLDEEAPHVHALVTPSAKYRFGDREIEMLAFAKVFSDTPQVIKEARDKGDPEMTKLGRLQSAYAEAMKPLGLQRGLNFRYRPSKRKEQEQHKTPAEHYSDLRVALAQSVIPPLDVKIPDIPDKPGITDIVRIGKIAEQLRESAGVIRDAQAKINGRLRLFESLQAENKMLQQKLEQREQVLHAWVKAAEDYKRDLEQLRPYAAAARKLDAGRVCQRLDLPEPPAGRRWNAIDHVMKHRKVDYLSAVKSLLAAFPGEIAGIKAHASTLYAEAAARQVERIAVAERERQQKLEKQERQQIEASEHKTKTFARPRKDEKVRSGPELSL